MLAKADISLLLDYYGSFLTERRRELMRMSADEDMSLAEIAEQAGVSRQSVRDSIAKGSAELLLFEERLGLASRDRQLAAVASALEQAASSASEGELRQTVLKEAKRLRDYIR